MEALNTIQLNDYVGDKIEDFLNEYKIKSIHSFKSYRSSINKIFKDVYGITDYKFITKYQVEGLSIHVLKDYFNDISNQVNEDDEIKYKNATLNKHISVIKELIKYLRAWDYIEYDLSKLELLKLFPDTREEIEMIPFDLAMKYVEHFKTEKQGLEKSLIIKLAIETALRASELLSITWSNFKVVEDGVILKSHGNNKGKGNKEWIDKIDRKLYQELLQLKEIGNTERLFNLSYKQLNGMMDRGNELLNDTGINYTFHSFKKLAVTQAYIQSGNCIETARKKARHTNVNTTIRYLRLTDLTTTGVISKQLNTEADLYKNVPRNILIEAIENALRPEMKLLLNAEIKNLMT